MSEQSDLTESRARPRLSPAQTSDASKYKEKDNDIIEKYANGFTRLSSIVITLYWLEHTAQPPFKF
jgi:hypothetical protein